MTDDIALLREFAVSQSESAFRELVTRHMNLVYSSALRQVRDPHLAEEVAQAVFIILSGKADTLKPGVILGGWLHHTTRNVAANALKSEFRRRQRETEAHAEAVAQSTPAESVWRELLPALDEALESLKPAERDALVLRYFESRSLSEVATAMGLQERAAQKRVARSLEKLRGIFLKRGITVSAAALATAVSANSVHAAPVNLSVAILGAVKGSASATASTFAHATLKAMAWTKVKVGLALIISATVAISLPIIFAHPKPAALPAPTFAAFTSLDPDGGSDHDYSWMISGAAGRYRGKSLGYRGHAEWFIPKVSGKLSTIDIAARAKSAGHGNLTFYVAQDSQGKPGDIVEMFANVVVPDMDQVNYTPFTLKSARHPNLQAGTKYWFVAVPPEDNTTMYWFYTHQTNTQDYGREISAGVWTNIPAIWLDTNELGMNGKTNTYHNAAFSVNILPETKM